MTSGRGPVPAAAALIAAGLAALGCGSSAPSRHELQGTVLIDGMPIPAGFAVFTPDVAAGGTGLQGAALIRDGRLATRPDGRGVTGGAYLVTVHGYDGVAYEGAEERVALGRPLFAPVSAAVALPDRPAAVDLRLRREADGPPRLDIVVD